MTARPRTWAVALACAPALALAGPALAAPARSGPVEPEVLAEGLVGALSLSVARDGTAYVAEQFAGRLTEVSADGATRTVTQGAVGGVDATGRGTLTVTLSAPPEGGSPAPFSVARVDSRGGQKVLGSLIDHETATNPDGGAVYGFVGASEACLGEAGALGLGPYTGIVESNPYKVLVDGGARVVADAAANAIVRVSAGGRTSTVAVLPPVEVEFGEEQRQGLIAQFNEGVPPEQQLPPETLAGCVGETFTGEPVPTDVERGPDGTYYVSSLPGFPEAPGTGAVYRVDPRTGEAERWAEGFSGAVDVAVADDGTVYVVELFGGQLTRIAPDGGRSSVPLDSPGAVEVDRRGAVYVTTGVFGPGGQLLRYSSWAG
ncbi:ScyD/ScyE family protein [Aquipuribacter hungaricus]|uniref:ScyD/ScyE family protein n=1 Tax=Aquipuribacter hungaricus TaxID=545624 RepID=A0ABV7WIW5_9MICO